MIWRGKGRAASVPSVQLDRMEAAAENFPALRSAHHMILIQANAPMDRSTTRYRHDQRLHLPTVPPLPPVALPCYFLHPLFVIASCSYFLFLYFSILVFFFSF